MKTLKYSLTVMIMTMACLQAMPQKHFVADLVQKKMAAAKNEKTISNLLLPNDTYRNAGAQNVVSSARYFTYDPTAAKAVLTQQADVLSLSLTNEDNTPLLLDLISSGESFAGTSVTTASGKNFDMSQVSAAHYRGIVRGQEKTTIASISIYDNEISGFISTSSGNLVIGKIEGAGVHVLYNDRNLKVKNPFACGTREQPLTAEEQFFYQQSQWQSLAAVAPLSKCVRLYYETEFDIFQNKGSVANVVSYITGLHNQVATIYLNEGIRTPVSQIRVWDVNDPYNGGSTAALLAEFQANTSAINGDLGQLLTFRNIGGGQAAGFAGICAANVDNSLSVSLIYSTYSNFPVYSWPIYVVTHEFGHTFGSRHTHACVWNGNNTAIDGCSGFTEGGCALPGQPAGGGTIMSYCHNAAVGINFNLGFGQQPGDLIRARVNAGACLGNCCAGNVTITGNYTTPLTESSSWIASSGATSINAGSRVKLDANPGGGYVLLSPGFVANTSSVFVAQAFNGCTTGEPLRTYATNGTAELTAVKAAPDGSGKGLLLFPNPATNILYIQTPELPAAIASVELRDAQGRQVAIKLSTGGRPSINTATLAPGSYFLKVNTKTTSYNAMFIKQ